MSKLTTCRLITVKEGKGTYWNNLLNVANTNQRLKEENLDEELLTNGITKKLVKQFLAEAYYIQIKNVKRTNDEVTFDETVDNIRARRFKGQIFPEASHHEIYARIPRNKDGKIGFLFGQSVDTYYARSRLSMHLAQKGAYTDVPISSEAISKILSEDCKEFLGISLKDVRAKFKTQYQGSSVDQGMSDSIARDRGQGGKDDGVEFLSWDLGLKVH
ncbi:MAG: hypothetical protein JRN15_02220, partial [Nitrososphaerota archaeon]|nr:hypothetical protein [Nitrososphaerota archaeon]